KEIIKRIPPAAASSSLGWIAVIGHDHLGRYKNHYGKAMSTETPNGGGADYQTHGERITNPAQIVRLLERVKENRALLTITIPGINTIYNSAILGISFEQKHLLLDELLPADGHERLINAAEFH